MANDPIENAENMVEGLREDVAFLTQRLAEVERERDALRLELDACRHTNNGLHKDKVRLAAMVGRLREHLEDAESAMEMFSRAPGSSRDDWDFDDDRADIRKALAETPPEALRHIRAEAAIKAFDAGVSYVITWKGQPNGIIADATKAANDYAQKIRNGEVE